jgi:hypothetical protein
MAERESYPLFYFEITTVGESNRGAFTGYIPSDALRLLTSSPNVLALGALSGGWAVGALVFEVRGGNVNILSLCVDPSCYQEGAGVDLLLSLQDIVQKSDEVLSISGVFAASNADEQLALSVAYLEAGFTLAESESKRYVLSLDRLLESKELQGGGSVHKSVHLLSDLPEEGLKLLNRFLYENDNAYIDLPLQKGDLLSEISVLSMGDNNRPDGAVLFNNRTNSGFTLALMLFKDRAASLKAMPMLRTVMEAARKTFRPGMEVRICALNEFSDALVRKLAKDALLYTSSAMQVEWLKSERGLDADDPSFAELVVDYIEDLVGNDEGETSDARE